MKVKAVITGDIISSRKISDKSVLVNRLNGLFNEFLKGRMIDNFDMYRGDSFQLFIDKPEIAMHSMISLRAGLRMGFKNSGIHMSINEISTFLDARLSLGIGEVSYMDQDVTLSNGQAFEISGKGLDKITKEKRNMYVETCWPDVNLDFEISSMFADQILSNLSMASAQVLYLKLTNNYTQEELSGNIGISQPAVHKRLKLAHFDLLIAYIHYFRDKILKLTDHA